MNKKSKVLFNLSWFIGIVGTLSSFVLGEALKVVDPEFTKNAIKYPSLYADKVPNMIFNYSACAVGLISTFLSVLVLVIVRYKLEYQEIIIEKLHIIEEILKKEQKED